MALVYNPILRGGNGNGRRGGATGAYHARDMFRGQPHEPVARLGGYQVSDGRPKPTCSTLITRSASFISLTPQPRKKRMSRLTGPPARLSSLPCAHAPRMMTRQRPGSAERSRSRDWGPRRGDIGQLESTSGRRRDEVSNMIAGPAYNRSRDSTERSRCRQMAGRRGAAPTDRGLLRGRCKTITIADGGEVGRGEDRITGDEKRRLCKNTTTGFRYRHPSISWRRGTAETCCATLATCADSYTSSWCLAQRPRRPKVRKAH